MALYSVAMAVHSDGYRVCVNGLSDNVFHPCHLRDGNFALTGVEMPLNLTSVAIPDIILCDAAGYPILDEAGHYIFTAPDAAYSSTVLMHLFSMHSPATVMNAERGGISSSIKARSGVSSSKQPQRTSFKASSTKTFFERTR